MKHLAIIMGVVLFSWFTVTKNTIKYEALNLDEIELNLVNLDYENELESIDMLIQLEEVALNLYNLNYADELDSVDKAMKTLLRHK